MRQVGFGDYGEEGVTEDGWMEGIPEESVVGVGADRIGCDAWIGDVGEAEVGGVGGYGLEEAEDVEAADMNALKKLLDEEKVVE